ncbi:MAG: hypothetical protein K0S01_51 [Herbinix sp.]|jgi:uncharacterized protein YqhQ|nr:hypothetical protein [Herbinix sp.]
MKPSGIGGMAVMEGVMMKNKDEYAVAVRKPNNEIAVEKNVHKDISDKIKLFKLPVFRGMLAFVDSMLIGVKVLNFSASFFEEEEEKTLTEKQRKKLEKKNENKAKMSESDFAVEEVSITHSDEVSLENTESKDSINQEEMKEVKEDKSSALFMALAVLVSIVISVSLFMVLPVLLTNLLTRLIENRFLISFIEGIVRLSIFMGYVILASRMPEIKRVFMYHGAEHKTINCLESGFELTVENVKWQSKQHKRCGTSFMLLVMLISLVFFMILPSGNLLWRVLSRIILVPFIAGVSYEFIRLAGKSESKIVHILSQPGLWMQGLTTKEPDDAMIEVAIESVGAVFDWRAFLETSATSKVTITKNEVGNKKANTAVKNIKLEKQTNATKHSNEVIQTNESKHTNAAKQAKAAKQDNVTKTESVANHENTVNSNKGKKQNVPNKNDNADKGKATTHVENRQHNTGAAPINFKAVIPNRVDEEDDEILNALDKFFDDKKK